MDQIANDNSSTYQDFNDIRIRLDKIINLLKQACQQPRSKPVTGSAEDIKPDDDGEFTFVDHCRTKIDAEVVSGKLEEDSATVLLEFLRKASTWDACCIKLLSEILSR